MQTNFLSIPTKILEQIIPKKGRKKNEETTSCYIVKDCSVASNISFENGYELFFVTCIDVMYFLLI